MREMRRSLSSCRGALAAVALTLLALTAVAQSVPAADTPLQVKGKQFLLRGEPFQILSGELEYARIPREDWRDRLRKVRGLGLNTITVYVFWNLHEPKPGVYDFSGQNDVAEFLREAQQEGLYVVLRQGPYVCAEWDLGGYPAWMLKDPQMVLRSSQPEYLQAARRWMMRLGQELAPLQASRGGPILAVQVENEYGSFVVPEDGGAYLRAVKQMVVDAGFGESLLYTADGGDVMAKGSLPGVLAAVDYGTGDAERSIALLQKFRPDAPVYVDGVLAGVIDRRLGQTELKLSVQAGQRLDLLVENSGRINFTTELRGERAGILGSVLLNGHVLRGWQMVRLPLDEPPTHGYAERGCTGPCFFRGELRVAAVGDTFLNTASLGKGVVWVNGHLLGRFWDVGPMGSLYLPGAWLYEGANSVVVFDLNGGDGVSVRGDDEPTYLAPAAEKTAP